MSKVVSLPGVFRPEDEQPVAPDVVLRNALDAGLRDVVVVGRSLKGDIQVWSSQPDPDTGIGLMMRGLTWLAEANPVHEG